MHAVEALFAGVRGAENGTARIYTRGTTTPATWYEDFEGTAATSGTVTLDDSGRAEVYVNSLVDVVVYDADGTELFSYTPAVSTPDVEYQGSAFSGTNYTSGATGSGSGYAVSLHTILARALTSFGADDWEVLLDGTATSLQNAVGALSGLVYNVRSPAYGADGDGVEDDTSAIAAAITAANAAGGGIVFVPEGTYRITSALTLTAGVSLVGAGSHCTTITMDHASNNTLVLSSAGTAAPQVVAGIEFAAAQANSGTVVSFGSSFVRALFSACYFGSSNNTGTIFAGLASGRQGVSLRDCMLTSGATTSSLTTGTIVADNCWFIAPAGAYSPTNGMVYTAEIHATRCRFDTTLATSGTVSCIKFSSTTLKGRVSGAVFENGGGATVTAFELGTYAAASNFEESGSIFGSSVTAYSYTMAVASEGALVRLATRDHRVLYTTNSANSWQAQVSQYGRIYVNSSYAGNVTIATDAAPPDGSKGVIHVYNSNGTNRDFTPSGSPAFFPLTSAKTINTTDENTLEYIVHIFNDASVLLNYHWYR